MWKGMDWAVAGICLLGMVGASVFAVGLSTLVECFR